MESKNGEKKPPIDTKSEQNECHCVGEEKIQVIGRPWTREKINLT